jgi:hypothetical protein
MAGKAFLRENVPHVAIEIDRRSSAKRKGGTEK